MHGSRVAYYILGEGVIHEPEFLSGGHGGAAAGVAGAPASFRFGRMFPRRERRMTSREWFELSEGLVKLGLRMNEPPPAPAADSTIPSGYTYLGQLIAHEITFDNTQDLPLVEPDPENLRSPSLDLDSLYGNGPNDPASRAFYEDGPNPARLRFDYTLGGLGNEIGFAPDNSDVGLPNDLPRDHANHSCALVGDRRNDENLAVAQLHVALIKFHNKVVEELKGQGHSAADLFDCARTQVVRHFQWLILHDYLPKLVDEDIVACVRDHGCRWFRVGSPEELYMPLEFSAAAFRLGHTMVRGNYRWNRFHADGEDGTKSARLEDLFVQTAANGDIGKFTKRLPHDWVIDWRRFFQFPGNDYRIDEQRANKARKIDTQIDMHLDRMMGFDHGKLPPEKRSITVRNLLRGFALGLPTGEEAAERMGEEPLTHEEVTRNCAYADLFDAPAFAGKTPLWYYILKEAEVKKDGNKLGRVGGRIVAETLIGLIKNSDYSILNSPGWYPIYTARGARGTDSAIFEMVDLLKFAAAVNPYDKPEKTA